MKKIYMKPQVDVVLMKMSTLLMASGNVQGSVRQYWDESANDEEEGL